MKRSPLRYLALALLLPLGLLTTGAAQAQYPTKPVRIIVPHAAGGAVDGVARILAGKLTEVLGQNVNVENRAGASGTIGAEYVAKSAPDGYTLYVNASIHTINPYVMKEKARFDAVKDFTPLSNLAQGPLLFSVNPGVPAKNAAEFVALVKADPKKYAFATSGFGSAGHLGEEFLKLRAGLDIPIVLYKGAAPALTDVIGGAAQAMMDPILSSGPHVKAGKLKPMAITAAKRSPLFPEVPTMIESGFPGFEFYSWYGLWGPANLPKDIAAKVEQAAIKAMQAPEIRERLISQGFEPVGSNGAEFGKFIEIEDAKYAKIVKDANIQAQ
jgi:tripartite-type tricarboxylate transporter receptor subunit TctC